MREAFLFGKEDGKIGGWDFWRGPHLTLRALRLCGYKKCEESHQPIFKNTRLTKKC